MLAGAEMETYKETQNGYQRCRDSAEGEMLDDGLDDHVGQV